MSEKKKERPISRFEYATSEIDQWLRDVGVDVDAEIAKEQQQDGDTDRPPVEPAKPR